MGVLYVCRQIDVQSGTVSRLGSKLKGAIRGAIDGAPLDATEVPTVWDAFTDENQVIFRLTAKLMLRLNY